MMKLSDLIHKLQQLEKEHGDVDFCIEVNDETFDSEIDSTSMLGNDFVKFSFTKDRQGDWACLHVVSRKPVT